MRDTPKETTMATSIAEYALDAHEQRRRDEELTRAARALERAEREKSRTVSARLEAIAALRDRLGVPEDLLDQVRHVRHSEGGADGLLEWVLLEFDVADLDRPMRLVVRWHRGKPDDPGPYIHVCAGHWQGLGRPAHGHRLKSAADLGERIDLDIRDQQARKHDPAGDDPMTARK